MMENNKLLIAIPTYNRPEYIKELLDLCAALYKRYNTDIAIYDSSTNDETYKVVERFSKEYKNIFYIKIDPAIQSNEKFLNIMKGEYNWNKSYEYIWLWGDSIRYLESALKKVLCETEKCRDIIVTDIMNTEHIGYKEYYSSQTLFEDMAWYMTLYGGVVLRRKTILENVDWPEIYLKYMTKDTFNYCQVGLYFEQLVKLEKINVVHLEMKPEEGYMRRREENGWYAQRIEFMCVNWINTINSLPKQYYNKDLVIRKYGIYSDAFSNRSIYLLRMNGIYDFAKFWKYRSKWKKITDTSIVWLFIVAVLPPFMVERLFKLMLYGKSTLRKIKNG